MLAMNVIKHAQMEWALQTGFLQSKDEILRFASITSSYTNWQSIIHTQ